MKNDKSRIESLDVAKAIAIIFVIVGHAIQYSNGYNYRMNGMYYDNVIFKFIYSFHLPLFMMISGYLSYFSHKKYGSKKWIIRRATQLLPPVLFWGGILTCIKIILGEPFSFSLLAGNLTGPLWFLISVFILSGVVAVVQLCRFKYLLYIIIFLGCFITPDLALQKFMYPYFVVGYLICENKDNLIHKIKFKSESNIKIVCFIICGLIFFLLFPFYNKDCFIYTTGITIIHKSNLSEICTQIVLDLYRYIIGFVGSFFIICLSYFISKVKMISKYAVGIGKNTMGIYIIQMMLYLLVITRVFSELEPNVVFVVSVSITVLIVSLIMCWLTEKNELIKRIIL